MRARLPLCAEISQAKFSQFQSETALFRDSLEAFTVRSHRRRRERQISLWPPCQRRCRTIL